MNNIIVKTFLQQRAEEMAPASEINLWPSIQARLSSRHAVLLSSNGGSKMKPSGRRFSILAPISLAIIVAVIFMAITPQGRALAQHFLSLFFQTASDIRPLDPTTAPTVITPTANGQAVEDLTQWHLFKPSWLPEGFGLNRTEYRPEKGGVYQVYLYQRPFLYQHATGLQAAYFFLGQQKTSFTDLWPVGESAKVETVQVGDVTGDYVIGAWGNAEDHLVWENNPAIQHLRWQANGYYFDLQFDIYGVQEADFADCPYYISKEQLIDIASSMK